MYPLNIIVCTVLDLWAFLDIDCKLTKGIPILVYKIFQWHQLPKLYLVGSSEFYESVPQLSQGYHFGLQTYCVKYGTFL